MASNIEKLEDAGLIRTGALPKAHKEVLEDLSEEEMAVILDVAARLIEADQQEGLTAKPAFTTYYTF